MGKLIQRLLLLMMLWIRMSQIQVRKL